MSTLKSNNENMTINADGASSEIILQQNGTEIGRIGSGFAGTSGQVLTSNGAGAAPTMQAGGKVLQVVENSAYTETLNASPSQNTWYDTVVTASITPKSTTSRIQVLTTFGLYANNNSGNYGNSNRIKRDIGGTVDYPAELTFHNPGGTNLHASTYENSLTSTILSRLQSITTLDAAHSTSSQITYTLQMGAFNSDQVGAGGVYSARWSMTLVEIEQ